MNETNSPTEILRVNPNSPEPEIIAQAVAVLRRDELVAFPTETVYGLGANALNPDAVAKIFAAKGRPSNNPLIVHVVEVEAAQNLVTEWTETAARLTERFWPGPLTLVLPRREIVPDSVTGGGPTVAIRIPAHPVALALLRAIEFPLAAPSANRSLQLSPTQAAHVARSLSGRIPLILDGGPTSGGLESTVLSLAENPPRLLRPGLISPSEIEALIGPIALFENVTAPADAPLPAPGMLSRHYAPRAPLILAAQEGKNEVEKALRAGLRVGWLTFEAQVERPGLTLIKMPSEANEYAARLYAELHTLDSLGVEHIIVARPPEGNAWLAIHDRLRRASTP